MPLGMMWLLYYVPGTHQLLWGRVCGLYVTGAYCLHVAFGLHVTYVMA